MTWYPRGRLLSALGYLDRIPASLYLTIVGALLAGVWVVINAVIPGETTEWNHVYYLPIVLAALRFGPLAGAGSGLLAGMLVGPLAGQVTLSVALSRTALFAAVGGIIGALAQAGEEGLRRERDVAGRETALISQRASLVQLVSHEFRTPLTIIRGSLETLARREGAVAPAFRDLLVAAERSVDRLQEMVDVVLAAADELDAASTPRVRVDVAPLVRHAARSLRPDLVRRLNLDIPSGATVVTVEPYLWLTLRCLLDNAMKLSPADQPIDVTYVERGGWVNIAVIDRGPGLPDGFERLAFEPFLQADGSTSRLHSGLGVGLYTARRLARRLGGEVTLASPAVGTTATVRLPRARDADAPAEPTVVLEIKSSVPRNA